MALVADLVPAPDVEQRTAAIARASKLMLESGVTAWQEPILGDYPGVTESTDAYLRLLADGDLSARVGGAIWVPRSLTVDEVPRFVADAVARRERAAEGGFDASTAKIMVDRIVENRTAALHEPYFENGCACGAGERGLAYFTRDVLEAVTGHLAEAGFALDFRAISDRAEVSESACHTD